MDLVALLCLVARARMGAMCADQSSAVGESDGCPGIIVNQVVSRNYSRVD